MTGVVAAALLFVAIGFPVAVRLSSAGWSGRVALGYLIGATVCTVELTLLSLLGIRWHVAWFILAALATLAFAGLWRKSATSAAAGAETSSVDGGRGRSYKLRPHTWIHLLVLCAMSAAAFFHAGYATLTPPWQWDWAAVWGLKAKLFYAQRGIDFTFLSDPSNAFAHPDYPPLIPLSIDVAALIRGSWNDGAAGLLYTFFGMAAGWGSWCVLRRAAPASVAAVASVAIALVALAPWVGLADGPLIAFVGVGCSLLWRFAVIGDRRDVWLGFVILGGAALTKNEGLAIAIAAAAALALQTRRWRLVTFGAVPVLVAAPWLIARVVYQLATDHASGNVMQRVAMNGNRLGDIAEALATHHPDKLLFWCFAIAAVVAGGRRLLRERFLLSLLAAQLIVYGAAYLTSPHGDVAAHVANSWPRLAWHLAPVLILLTVATTDAAGARTSGENQHRRGAGGPSPLPRARPHL